MKQTKKVIAMLLAMAMVLALGMTAFAQNVMVGTGQGSITIEEIQPNQTYAIYKLFDATVSDDETKIAYTTTRALDATGLTWFDSRDIGGGKYEITAKPTFNSDSMKPADTTKPITDPINAEYKKFADWAKSYGRLVTSVKSQEKETSIVFQNVEYGYYMVTTTYGFGAISVTSTQKHGVVIEKNNVPTWDNDEGKGKVIVNAAGQHVKLDGTALGKDIKFDIGVNATNYDREEKIYRYMIQDIAPEGMTYRTGGSNFKVVVKDNGVEKDVPRGGTTGYTLRYYSDEAMTKETTDMTKARAFKVFVPWTKTNDKDGEHLYANKSEIHIRYIAFMDPQKAGSINYTGANTNKSQFNYWKAPDDPNNEPNHFSPESTTDTYTTEVKLLKIDAKTRKPLEGAQFTLTGDSTTVAYTQGTRFVENPAGAYWKIKNGSYTMDDPNKPGMSQAPYFSTTLKYEKVEFKESQGAGQTVKNIPVFVNPNGTATFSGLGEGTKYKIEETVVPDGYNKAADIKFTLKFNPATKDWSLTQEGQAGQLTGNTFTIEVENKPGTPLPGTGGVGTTIFYALGSLLVIGAGVMLFARKRMKQQEN